MQRLKCMHKRSMTSIPPKNLANSSYTPADSLNFLTPSKISFLSSSSTPSSSLTALSKSVKRTFQTYPNKTQSIISDPLNTSLRLEQQNSPLTAPLVVPKKLANFCAFRIANLCFFFASDPDPSRFLPHCNPSIAALLFSPIGPTSSTSTSTSTSPDAPISNALSSLEVPSSPIPSPSSPSERRPSPNASFKLVSKK